MSSIVVPFPQADSSSTKPVTPPCADRPAQWWVDGAHEREAKKICQRCRLRDRCLTEALVSDERVGIWGGLTAAERAALPDADLLQFRRRRAS